LYPKVFDEFVSHVRSYGDVSLLPSPIFFFGPAIGEEFSIDIEPGKRLIVKFLAVGEPRPNGTRVVYFELNGQPREIEVLDKSIENKEAKRIKADAADPTHIAAGMPGMVIGVAVSVGTKVKKGQKLLALEAMKMETSIAADRDGEITQLYVHSGSQVEAGDLLLVLK
jgi:pyruvate carboxylase